MSIGPKPRGGAGRVADKPVSVPVPSLSEMVRPNSSPDSGSGVAEDGLSGAVALERSQLFGEA